jgi:hypothetical protein
MVLEYILLEFSGGKGHFDYSEQQYKNYKRHGQQKTFSNGVLTLYQEMENGIENGYMRHIIKMAK